MVNCAQNFFEVHHWLLRRWDLCRTFDDLTQTTIRIRLNLS